MLDTSGFGAEAWLLVFAVSAALVAMAGTVLARSGDEIAARTGLGGLFVGMLLLAAATSLPELLTAASAAAADAPDLAIGDLLGSSMANMAILAIIDLAYHRRVWPSVGVGHARLAAVAIVLTTIGVLGILVPVRVHIGWIGADTLLIVVAYVAAAAWVRRSGPRPVAGASGAIEAVEGELLVPTGWSSEDGGSTARGPVLHRATLEFIGATLVILVSAPIVAVSGKGLATTTGISESFVGVALLAIATSLPELVASLAAVRIGAHDLAVGNLFGSNAINMTMLLVTDLAYTRGPILAAAGTSVAVAGMSAILLMGLAVAAIVQGDRVRAQRLEPDALVLLVAYVVTMLIVASSGPG